MITSLSGHSDNVHSVAFSSDGRVIASGSYRTGNTVCFWEPITKELIKTITSE